MNINNVDPGDSSDRSLNKHLVSYDSEGINPINIKKF
jgi:hypothetical protein